ncbi:MAG: GDP-L-fucose synthase [Deltaproteobacteria bacterium]|nr:GDP-L-fucose synthase [Deltaproteobacteria bacterium]
MSKESKVFVAGHNGMVGSAIVRGLKSRGMGNIVTRSRTELDLTDQRAVRQFFETQRPEHVFLAAAKVGGIHANNTYPADFIYSNLIIQSNVLEAAFCHGVKRLLFLGSSCIYPREAGQPMSEAALMSGPLEPTNEPYAVAKIAGIKMCEAFNRQHGTQFRSVMPTNLYGENDNFHPENSHVIPALVRRFHEAKIKGQKSVVVWGTGNARREFLHVDDMAAACLHVMQLSQEKYLSHTAPMLSHINIGVGRDITIRQLAETVKRVVGYPGEIVFDRDKPDGPGRKFLDTTKLTGLGWQPEIGLEEGLTGTYQWFLKNQDGFRSV